MSKWGNTLFFAVIAMVALVVCVSDLSSVMMNSITALIVKLGAAIVFVEMAIATFTAFCRALS